MTEPVVALHGEDLFGLLTVENARELDRQNGDGPGAWYQRLDEQLHRKIASNKAGKRGGAATCSEECLEAREHHIWRIGHEEGIVGVT